MSVAHRTQADVQATYMLLETLRRSGDARYTSEQLFAIQGGSIPWPTSHWEEDDYYAITTENLAGVSPLQKVLFNAIDSGNSVEISYQARSGEALWRSIRPLELYHYAGHFYVSAYCELRKDDRTFRIDRISNIRSE